MTIEQLLSMDADTLDKLTDAELQAYFAPYLDITRPKTVKPAVAKAVTEAKKIASIQDKAKRFGIDLSFLND